MFLRFRFGKRFIGSTPPGRDGRRRDLTSRDPPEPASSPSARTRNPRAMPSSRPGIAA